jgi:GNAT superfamily N-acetyltransferase
VGFPGVYCEEGPFLCYGSGQVTLYQDETGYITGFWTGEYWWVGEFSLLPEYRGRGLARGLARHVPARCLLLAFPFAQTGGETLEIPILVRFWESLGFRHVPDLNGFNFMTRG